VRTPCAGYFATDRLAECVGQAVFYAWSKFAIAIWYDGFCSVPPPKIGATQAESRGLDMLPECANGCCARFPAGHGCEEDTCQADCTRLYDLYTGEVALALVEDETAAVDRTTCASGSVEAAAITLLSRFDPSFAQRYDVRTTC
jgi:hypothetical protein